LVSVGGLNSLGNREELHAVFLLSSLDWPIVQTGLTGQDDFPPLSTKEQALEIASLALIKLLIGI
jgi:hypothetical protein